MFDIPSESEVTIYQKNTKDLESSFVSVNILNESRSKLSMVNIFGRKTESVIPDLIENEEYLFFVVYDDKKSKIRRYRHSKTPYSYAPIDHDPKSYFIDEYESDEGEESTVSSSK